MLDTTTGVMLDTPRVSSLVTRLVHFGITVALASTDSIYGQPTRALLPPQHSNNWPNRMLTNWGPPWPTNQRRFLDAVAQTILGNQPGQDFGFQLPPPLGQITGIFAKANVSPEFASLKIPVLRSQILPCHGA